MLYVLYRCHDEAKAQGCKGERISVVNLDTRKRVFARVLDARTVKVEF